MQVTVEIHKDNVELLHTLISEYHLEQPPMKEEEIVIPQWQQAMVLARIATNKREENVDFFEFMKELKAEDEVSD